MVPQESQIFFSLPPGSVVNVNVPGALTVESVLTDLATKGPMAKAIVKLILEDFQNDGPLRRTFLKG